MFSFSSTPLFGGSSLFGQSSQASLFSNSPSTSLYHNDREAENKELKFRSKNTKIDGKHLVRCITLSSSQHYTMSKKQLRINHLKSQENPSISKPPTLTTTSYSPKQSFEVGSQLQFNKTQQNSNVFRSQPLFGSKTTPPLFSQNQSGNPLTFNTSTIPVKPLFGKQSLKLPKEGLPKKEESQSRQNTPIQKFYSAFNQISSSTRSFQVSKPSNNTVIQQEQVEKVLRTLRDTEDFKQLLGMNWINFDVTYFSREVNKKLKTDEQNRGNNER